VVPGEALVPLVARVAATSRTRKTMANSETRYKVLLLIFPSSGPNEEATPFIGKRFYFVHSISLNTEAVKPFLLSLACHAILALGWGSIGKRREENGDLYYAQHFDGRRGGDD
jgi:hypothetical protein